MSITATDTQLVPPSRRLRAAMALALPALNASALRLWRDSDLAVVYPRYLMAMHHVIRASVPLMIEAADTLRRRPAADAETARGDQLAADYLEHHVPEETGHDDWALEDLERLGLSRQAVLAAHPYPAAAALAGTQYYYIRHHDPVAILGYIAQLEGYPPSEPLLLAAAERAGLPVAAFRTMRKHANLDPHHRADLDRLLDTVPLDAARYRLVLRSALDTADTLSTLITQVCAAPPALAPTLTPASA
jgi:hypothetical protein